MSTVKQSFMRPPRSHGTMVEPMQIHLTSAPCDIISFNGQGQLCKLTCAG